MKAITIESAYNFTCWLLPGDSFYLARLSALLRLCNDCASLFFLYNHLAGDMNEFNMFAMFLLLLSIAGCQSDHPKTFSDDRDFII